MFCFHAGDYGYEPAYLAVQLQKDDYVLPSDGENIYISSINRTDVVFYKPDSFNNIPKYIYLFTMGGKRFFLADQSTLDYQFSDCISLKEIKKYQTTMSIFAAGVACQLANWYKTHRFCSTCGHENMHSANERAMVCPQCKMTVYPKISPAVIVAIIRDNKLLLARGLHYGGLYFSLVAGYVEIGETLEAAAEREVLEETGLHIKNIRYFDSQPWPYTGSEMVGFFAETADTTEEIHLQEDELAEAGFYAADEMPAIASASTIAGRMIRYYMETEAGKH